MREEGRICGTLRYIPQEILWKMFCMGSSPYKTIVSALDSMASHDIKLISIFPSQVLTESKFGNAQWQNVSVVETTLNFDSDCFSSQLNILCMHVADCDSCLNFEQLAKQAYGK